MKPVQICIMQFLSWQQLGKALENLLLSNIKTEVQVPFSLFLMTHNTRVNIRDAAPQFSKSIIMQTNHLLMGKDVFLPELQMTKVKEAKK